VLSNALSKSYLDLVALAISQICLLNFTLLSAGVKVIHLAKHPVEECALR